jgi:hypothetical protein
MAPSGFSGIVGGHGIGSIRMFLEQPGQVPDSVGQVDGWFIELFDRAAKPHPTSGSCCYLHQTQRDIVNPILHATFTWVEARFLRDDSRHKNGIDMMAAGNLRDEVRIGDSWREKMGTQAPCHGLMNHPVQCATS